MANAIIGALRIVLGLDSAAFESGVGKAQKTLNKAAREFKSIGDDLRGVGTQMAAFISAPLLAAGAMIVKTTSDVKEMGSAFDYVFGNQSASVAQWAEETGDKIGRATDTMQSMALGFQQLFKQAAPTGEKAAELSKNFALLAQDLSSFYNTSESTALDKLRSGLMGEAEPLRDFGVFLTEAAVAHEAVHMGLAKTTKALTEQDKILARASLIWKATADAQGDAARTADGFENQWRALVADIREDTVKLGEILLPVVQKVVGNVREVVQAFGKLKPETQTAIVGFAAVGTACGPLVVALGTVVSGLGNVLKGLAVIGPLIGQVVAPAIAAGTAAWRAYMASVVLVGPAQATASAGAMALGAAVRFMLGPIGLAITAVGAITAAWLHHNEVVRQSKIASGEYTDQSAKTKTAVDAYADAVRAANLVTGEGRQIALDAAAAAKVQAQQEMANAEAKLASARAALSLAEANQRELASKPLTHLPDAATGDDGGLGISLAMISSEELKINKAKANIDAVTKTISDAKKKIKEADDILSAKPRETTNITDTTDAAKKAKDALADLKSELASVTSALATPDEAADKTYAETVATLNKARQASRAEEARLADQRAKGQISEEKYEAALHKVILTQDDYTEALRRAKVARDEAYGIGPVRPAFEMGKLNIRDVGLSDYEKAAAESAKTVAGEYKAAWREIGQAFKSATQEWVYTGKLNWRRLLADMLENWKSVMLVIADAWKKTQEAMQASRASGGGGGLGSIVSDAFKVFTGGKGDQSKGSGLSSLMVDALKALPGHADGTRSSPGGWHWVGERGPELMNMQPGAQVLNQSQLAAMLGGGGGAKPVFNFDLRGAVMTDDLLQQMNDIGAKYGADATINGAQGGAQLAGVNFAESSRRKLR